MSRGWTRSTTSGWRLRGPRTGLVAVASVVALAAASCGGGSGVSSSSAAKDKTVVVANSAILSGPQAAYAGISTGLHAYLDMANAQGGVNGYKFKIEERDNAYQPAQAVAVARQLMSVKPFVFISQGVAPTNAILALKDQITVPTFVVSDADLAKQGGSKWFGVEASFTRQVLSSAEYAVKHLSAKKIAFAYDQNPSADLQNSAMKTYVPSIGGELTGAVGFPVTATNFDPYASQLKATGADAVVLSTGGATMASLQKAADRIGYHPKWMGFFSAISNQYVSLAGNQAEGTYFENFYLPTVQTDNPAVAEFTKVVGAADPKAVNLLGELGWQVGANIVAGVKAATANGKALTQDSFVQAITNLGGKSVGVWPSATYTAQDHSGPTQGDILQVKGGKFVEVSPFKELPPLP